MSSAFKTLSCIVLVGAVALLPAAAGAQSWVRLGVGAAGMAMDDVNDAEFSFYEESIDGYAFPDVGTGLLMDLAAGYDVRPDLAIGFHWDRQWAKVTGSDGSVDGTLGLHANAVMGRVQWRPLQGGKWRLGAVAGLGPMWTDGYAKIASGTVNYGEAKLSGTTWAFDAAVAWDTALGASTRLDVWAGWRWATIDDLEAEDRPVLKSDGSPLSLDYTGWTARAGLVYVFGE